MQEDIEIDDVSLTPADHTRDEFLEQRDNWGRVYTRYNLGQVKRIIELVYMPHQVDQWNKVVDGDYVHCPTLSKDGKKVSLEEILPEVSDAAEKLFEAYVQIPKGSYYIMNSVQSLENCRDWGFLRKNGSPSSWISCKRFDGFVTKEVGFWYALDGHSSFCFPERQVFVPWELKGPSCLVNLDPKTKFYAGYGVVDESELRTIIDETYAVWEEIFNELRTEQGRDRFFSTPKFSGESEEMKQRDWKSYSRQSFNPEFSLYTSRHVCRKLGFYPETGLMSSKDELFGFVKRFLNHEEKGEPFSEYR